MRNRLLSIIASAAVFVPACNGYDDSSLWNDIDHAYNDLTGIASSIASLSGQVDMLSAVVNGGALTGISENPEGGYTVRYKGSDGEEKAVVIASKDDVLTIPVIGVKDDAGVLYWTITSKGRTDWLTDTDGSRIPVAGRTPSFAVDSEGFWTVNGNRIKDASGTPVKAEGKSLSVITSVAINEAGDAVITLGDGSSVTVPVFSSFAIELTADGKDVFSSLVVEDVSVPYQIALRITGEKASSVIVKLMRIKSLEAELNSDNTIVTLCFPPAFEQGGFSVLAADDSGNVIVRTVRVFAKDAKPEYYGIKTASDLKKFSEAVNSGKSIDRFRGESGDVILLQDIDMAGVTDWLPIGTDSSPFTGTFDGCGFSIKNVAFATDAAAYSSAGLFGVVKGGSVKNLTFGKDGDTWTFTGTAVAGTAIAGIAARVSEAAVITACNNNVDFDFQANDPAGDLVMIGGIAGQSDGAVIGGETAAAGCVNSGDIIVHKIDNTGNGGTGMNVGGILAYAKSTSATTLSNCRNTGSVCAQSGRGGGLAGTFEKGSLIACENAGLVEDDRFGNYTGFDGAYAYKRMGGLVGGTKAAVTIENCVNTGDVITYLGCRTGGFVGHNEGVISKCENRGNIIGESIVDGTNYHGPGWACGYNKTKANLTKCKGYGHVGGLAFKDAPQNAPAAMHINAVAHKNTSYDPEDNDVDWTLDAYFDWTLVETGDLSDGVIYSAYEFKNLPRKMKVLEIDLTKADVELTTCMADDIVPNPNANGNNNNGFCIRETLSQICARKRAEGQNVVAGINTGFFDSNDGIARGAHIEEGEPVYVNNPYVREVLGNHSWAFTVFTDKTASCAKKSFKGNLEVSGREYEYYSVNDTIVRHVSAKYPLNVYTSRYRKVPHADHPEIVNPLALDALYVIARYDSEPMKVNAGWASATVIAVNDGRTTALSEAPYLDDAGLVGIQISGLAADEIAAGLKAGDKIRLKAEMTVGGETKPVYMQNSTMFQFLVNGEDKSDTAPAGHTNLTQYDPVTYVAVDRNGTKVWLVEVDGRQAWVSMGLKSYEMARISLKLGAWNMTRFDGGGSSAMWVYRNGEGKLVSTPSDAKGERSCMNYIMVRVKK